MSSIDPQARERPQRTAAGRKWPSMLLLAGSGFLLGLVALLAAVPGPGRTIGVFSTLFSLGAGERAYL